MRLRSRINNPKDHGRSIGDVDVFRCCAVSVTQSLNGTVGSVDEEVRYTGPARYREAVSFCRSGPRPAGLRGRRVRGDSEVWKEKVVALGVRGQ